MNQRSFIVRALWDAEADAWVSESDIVGLHIETPDLDAFEALMMELAPELIIANHMSAEDLAGKPLKDLVPAIFWQRPDRAAA